jgi:AcrR family transcriptional regulator
VNLRERGGAPAQERELRAQGRKTMRRLLDAAMKVFDQRGYHGARVDDIVRVAKTSHGTFYLYFANKDDLFRALATDVAEQMLELSNGLGPVTADEAGFKEIRSWLASFTDLYRRYGPVIRAWTEAEVTDGAFGAMGTQLLASFARGLTGRIAEAGGGVDADVAATAMLAMIERFNYYAVSRQIDFDDDAVLDTMALMLHRGAFGAAPGRATRA